MSRPNILFLFTDQQRADTLGVVNPVMRTPVLDRLCSDGTYFTNAYTPAPVCVAARCALTFGQYAPRTGCFENNYPMPEVTTDRLSFMAALRDAGYQAHGIGKMHFTPDPNDLRGFGSRVSSEENSGPPGDDYARFLLDQGYDHLIDTQGARGEMYYIPQPSQVPSRAHHTHWTADQSIEFLRRRDQDRPFLLWASFIDPHPPFCPPAPWNKLYRAPAMPLPKRPQDFENLWTFMNRVQNRYKFRDAGIDRNLLRVMKAYYYATISFIDYNVGRILTVLEEQGQLDNTLILYTSDHGEFLGDYDCFGKRSFLKSAAQVPLVVRFPERFEAGASVSAPASLVDVLPTFLAAAGLPLPPQMVDGIDLAQLAADPGCRPLVFGHYQSGPPGSFNRAQYMALSEGWKYIYSASENREFLFDLYVDPEETRNVAETVGYLERIHRMRQFMFTNLRQMEYTPSIDGDVWRYFLPPVFPLDPDSGLLFQDPGWARSRMRIPGYTEDEDPPVGNVSF